MKSLAREWLLFCIVLAAAFPVFHPEKFSEAPLLPALVKSLAVYAGVQLLRSLWWAIQTISK